MDDKKIRDLLKPYRARIDDLDAQIITLLRQRYDVIEEVAHLKFHNGIDAFLQYRIEEVRENAASMAIDKGLDEAFIRQLWAQMIEHSCNLEDQIKKSLDEKQSRKAS